MCFISESWSDENIVLTSSSFQSIKNIQHKMHRP